MDFIDQYLDGLCRTCLIEVEVSSYGNNTGPQWQSILDRIPECDTLQIAELLSTAVPQIQIQPSDELPKKICHECLQQLLSAYRFQQMCVQSEEQMRDLVSTKHPELKLSIIEAPKEHHLETSDTDSKTLETAHATHQNLEHSATKNRQHVITERMAVAEAVQSSSFENSNSFLEACKDEEGRFNEFIKNEPIKGDGATMLSTNSVLSMGCEEEEINVTTDEVIQTETAQSGAAYHFKSIDQTMEHCKDSRDELSPFIKNEPIENDEPRIEYSDDKTIHSTISVTKDEVTSTEPEEGQAKLISPQYNHEKKNSDLRWKKYCTRSNAGRHLSIKHSIDEPNTEPIFKQHTCTSCDRSFKTATALKKHARTHTGVPPECEKSFSTSRLPRSDGDKPYECPYCPLRFRQRSNAIRHTKNHEVDNREACDICGKKVKSRNLKRHKLIHTGERLHKCDICEKRFIHPHTLRYHKRTHTGEKPFKCKYCELCCTTKSSLNAHLRIHLGNNVFRCEFCPLAFHLASKLRSHLTAHKNEDPETRERNMKALSEEEDKLKQQIYESGVDPPH